jgi:EAL domain-containing protein (putative c-di-GMP-specific phosphodiesterase class I)
MCLQSMTPVGLEVLLRWPHPSGIMMPPMEFIPIAEKSGLIVPIGQWILEQACQQLVQWHKKYVRFANLSISVNVSVKQFWGFSHHY